jgi:hypothetical protein
MSCDKLCTAMPCHAMPTIILSYSQVPTSKFETYCQMDLRLWPFDTQNCIIKLGSWTYNAFQINLLLDETDPVDVSYWSFN